MRSASSASRSARWRPLGLLVGLLLKAIGFGLEPLHGLAASALLGVSGDLLGEPAELLLGDVELALDLLARAALRQRPLLRVLGAAVDLLAKHAPLRGRLLLEVDAAGLELLLAGGRRRGDL